MAQRRRALASGVRHGRDLVRSNAKGALRVVSLFAANLLGVGTGLVMAVALDSSVTADAMKFTLFVLGVVNGWVMCLLFKAITGKARHKKSKRRKAR